MNLLFATQNSNKVKEIQAQIPSGISVKSLLDINYLEELEETQTTLEGNALQKVRFVHQKFGENCFADDTGLEVEALNGAPGVYSARYASENRKAQFRTVIACIYKGQEYVFEGICKGEITQLKRGIEGFGYDPIFQPLGYSQTFAEMPLDLKTKIGHRGKAVDQLISFFKEQGFS